MGKAWAWQVWARGGGVVARGESDTEEEAKLAMDVANRRSRGWPVKAWDRDKEGVCIVARGRGDFSDSDILGIVVDRVGVRKGAEQAER